jgi:hypothetical protein
MCRDLRIWAEDDDGNRIEALPVTDLIDEDPPESCTCWLGQDAKVDEWFFEKLRPYLEAGLWCRIVIEMH